MIQQRKTLSELSKALDLSVSTISKSLSDSSEISELTKKRVKDFAKKCNYVPNSFAASFRTGSTKTIGIIIPNITDSFYSEVLTGIENHLDSKGYRVLISISHESLEKEYKSMEMMSSGFVDGLIICPSKETLTKKKYEHFTHFKKQGIPLVLFDRISPSIKCDKVITDDFETSFKATEFLIRKHNSKRIALVSLVNELPQEKKLKLKGFKEALATYRIDYSKDYIIESNNVETFKKKIKVLLENKKVDGIFGVNESAVVNTIQVARSLGYNTSKALPIVAFYHQSQMAYDPSFTVINQHAKKVGNKASKIILNRIKNINLESYKTTIIKGSLLA